MESAGIMRKSTKKEKQQIREFNEHKAELEQLNENTIQIQRADSIVGLDNELGDGNESWDAEKNSTADVLVNFSAEQILMAKQAYQIIKKCFDVAIGSVKDSTKSIFIDKSFWEQEAYDVPLKDLAKVLGYKNSNPTQDFNRFVGKVNDCTEPSGVKVINPKEQIEFLKQILDADEGIA